MGGNIFEGTRRVSKEEFDTLSMEVVDYVRTNLLVSCPEDYVHITKSYRSKQSFGDIDVIINSNYLIPNYTKVLEEHHPEYVKNGDAVSFIYKGVQTDLILISDRYFKSACNYFSYNDLGNFIGVMSKKLGFKYGHKGATLIVRDEKGEVFLELPLTTDIDVILEMLDLDKEVYHRGFDTLEEIFTFVSKSKYFNPDLYRLDNRNHASRIRDVKRQTYKDFLNWMEGKEFPNAYNYPTKTSLGGYMIREPFYSEVILKNFPFVFGEILNKIAENNIQKEYKSKINGDIIMKITGLSGKELGLFIQKLKTNSVFSSMPIMEVIDMDDELIKELILVEFEVFNNINKFKNIWNQ